MKYAVIESGGKQYVAREGETVEVDRLSAAVGTALKIDAVLLAADGDQVLVGAPHVSGALVQATVQAEVRGPKVVVFRYAPKKRRRKRMGHRSFLTRLHVDGVTVPGGRSSTGEGAAPGEKAPAATRRKPAPAPKPRAAAGKPVKPPVKPTAKKPSKPKK